MFETLSEIWDVLWVLFLGYFALSGVAANLILIAIIIIFKDDKYE